MLNIFIQHYKEIRKRIPVRKILGLKSKDYYWRGRSSLKYYKVVRKFINELSPGDLIFDVGSMNTPVITWGKFNRRISLDLHTTKKKYPNVRYVVANWLDYELNETADLILCLQVLEHISDQEVGLFAKKLVKSARHAIISVPYKWKKGQCSYYLQDPVDLKKLEDWVGYPCEKYFIETRDKDQRLIIVFKGMTHGR